jgi:LysM repeat protein
MNSLSISPSLSGSRPLSKPSLAAPTNPAPHLWMSPPRPETGAFPHPAMPSPSLCYALRPLFVLIAGLLLASCKSSSPPGKLPKNLPNINVNSPAAPPRHSMSRSEYPFDSRGNYVASWAAGRDNQPASNPSPTTDYATWRSSHDSSPASSSSRSVADTPPEPPPAPRMVTSSAPRPTTTSTPRVTTTSTSSSPRVTTTSTSSTPKKPAPVKKSTSSSSSSASHTVKSGDTLYGLALRYKSTVSKIKSANGLKSDLIRPGQKLRIPR